MNTIDSRIFTKKLDKMKEVLEEIKDFAKTRMSGQETIWSNSYDIPCGVTSDDGSEYNRYLVSMQVVFAKEKIEDYTENVRNFPLYFIMILRDDSRYYDMLVVPLSGPTPAIPKAGKDKHTIEIYGKVGRKEIVQKQQIIFQEDGFKKILDDFYMLVATDFSDCPTGMKNFLIECKNIINK